MEAWIVTPHSQTWLAYKGNWKRVLATVIWLASQPERGQ